MQSVPISRLSALKAPPLLVALSHTDRLRPFNEWEPPYDIAAPAGRKAEAIREPVDATAEALGVTPQDIVPVRLDAGALYNVDALWAAVVARLPDARQGQLIRLLRLAAKGGGIVEVARQAVKGGRLLTGLVISAEDEANSIVRRSCRCASMTLPIQFRVIFIIR